ncbi:hypothetical protein HA402_005653 [Bradysia odoriphaga]|nr:hypothetical protein HA402_005653 [Bradysia odoriphaga]
MEYSKLNIRNEAIVRGVVELINQEYQNDLTNEHIQNVLDVERHSFVAHQGNTVHGFILISIPKRNPLMSHFIVDQGQRRKGIGKRLITMCLEDIDDYSRRHDNAYSSVYLHVPLSAETAKKTYEINGFQNDGLQKRDGLLGTPTQKMTRKIQQY